MQKRTAMSNKFFGIFQRGGRTSTISKSRNTHKRAAAPQHATGHGDRGAREGQVAAAPQMAHCRIFANYFCPVRVSSRGQNCGLKLETTSGKEIPCPDLSLRSGRNTPFPWIFRPWKLSEPTFVSTCSSVHGGESCIDQDLWPTSGYHKQWPEML